MSPPHGSVSVRVNDYEHKCNPVWCIQLKETAAEMLIVIVFESVIDIRENLGCILL